VSDPGLKLRRGPSFVLLDMPAFLPFYAKEEGGRGRSLDPFLRAATEII